MCWFRFAPVTIVINTISHREIALIGANLAILGGPHCTIDQWHFHGISPSKAVAFWRYWTWTRRRGCPVDLAPSRRISAAKHGENTVKRRETWWNIQVNTGDLVGGDWNHGILNDFPIILWMSSSQVTKSYFSEGLKPPTSHLSWFYNRNGSRSKTCDFFIKILTPHSKRCHTWSLIWVDQPKKLILSTLITKHVI